MKEEDIIKEASNGEHHQEGIFILTSKHFIFYVSTYKPNDFFLHGEQ